MVFDIHREAAARKTRAFSRFPQAAPTTTHLRCGKEGGNNLTRNPPQQGYTIDALMRYYILASNRVPFRRTEFSSWLG